MRRDDDAQLMLLAGFVLGIALVVTSLTISEVAELEKEAAREQDVSFLVEYRTLREKLSGALTDSTTSQTQRATFLTTFVNLKANFEQLENSRGYSLVMILGGGDCVTPVATRSECVSYTAPNLGCPLPAQKEYEVAVWDSAVAVGGLDGACYDGTDDGVLQDSFGVIKAAVVYVELSNTQTTLSEMVYFKLNR